MHKTMYLPTLILTKKWIPIQYFQVNRFLLAMSSVVPTLKKWMPTLLNNIFWQSNDYQPINLLEHS